MFKNKNIKKFISIVCSILTLNSVTSLSQTKVDALQIEPKKDDGYEYANVTLDKPFYYITVYDEQLPKTQEKYYRSRWLEVTLQHCLEVENINAGQPLTAEETPISEYGQKLKEVFNKADDSDDIALILAVKKTENLQTFPRLPWMLVQIPSDAYKAITEKIKNPQKQPPEFLPTVTINGTIYIPCVEVPQYRSNSTELKAVALNADQQDVTMRSKEGWLAEWRTKAKIMTVGGLKEWIRNNNQQLAQELGIQEDPATQHTSKANISQNGPNNKSIIKKSKDELVNKSYNVQSIEFKEKNVSTFNKGNQDELIIEEQEQTTIPQENATGDCQQKLYTTSPELNSCKKPITRNILCNTNKLIKKHPKTSVGLAATILALVGTIIYKIQKLFTRKSQKSQAKNQVTQKYNQHVKNKI